MVSSPLDVEGSEVHAGDGSLPVLEKVVRHLLRDEGVQRLHRRVHQADQQLVHYSHVEKEVRLEEGVTQLDTRLQDAERGRHLSNINTFTLRYFQFS